MKYTYNQTRAVEGKSCCDAKMRFKRGGKGGYAVEERGEKLLKV